MGIFSTWKNKKVINEKQNGKMERNIYEDKGTDIKEHAKRFNWIHTFMKYKIIVPALRLLKVIGKKHLVTEVPDKIENVNIKIFNDSFESALNKWSYILYTTADNGNNKPTFEEYLNSTKKYESSQGSLRIAKETILTVVLYDSAYREFLNIWMHEQARMMADYYSKMPNKTTGHLFSSDDIYNVEYFFLFKRLHLELKVSLEQMNNIYKEHEQEILKYNDAKIKRYEDVCRNVR